MEVNCEEQFNTLEFKQAEGRGEGIVKDNTLKGKRLKKVLALT
jgi:hypothetical protein